jgi:outer membrane receptor protein involved in Fe transport
VGPGTSLTASAALSATSGELTGYSSESPVARIGGYSLVDVRLGITHASWRTSLYVRNLLDKPAIAGLYDAYGSNVPGIWSFALNQPRTIGVDVGLRF